jgi:hypothetical protein
MEKIYGLVMIFALFVVWSTLATVWVVVAVKIKRRGESLAPVMRWNPVMTLVYFGLVVFVVKLLARW